MDKTPDKRDTIIRDGDFPDDCPKGGNSEISDYIKSILSDDEPYILMNKDNIREMLEDHREMVIKELDASKKRYESEPSDVIHQMKRWIDKVCFSDFVRSISRMVIGQEELEDILLNVYMYISNHARGVYIRNNILMAAPSGCGKTETYRALKQYFSTEIPKLPVGQVDITSITPEGYRGGDTEDVIMPLISNDSDGIGLIFLDEFDKCLLSSSSEGKGSLNGEVQNMLLTIVEGRQIGPVDTNKTMFIGMGSFDSFRKERSKKSRGIGFAGSVLPPENGCNLHYSPISIEEIRDKGAIPELLGRFVTIINYHILTEEAIDKIINRAVKNLSDTFGAPIILSEEMREHLHNQANTVYGCRLINNTIHNSAAKLLKQYLTEGRKISSMMLYLDAPA